MPSWLVAALGAGLFVPGLGNAFFSYSRRERSLWLSVSAIGAVFLGLHVHYWGW